MRFFRRLISKKARFLAGKQKRRIYWRVKVTISSSEPDTQLVSSNLEPLLRSGEEGWRRLILKLADRIPATNPIWTGTPGSFGSKPTPSIRDNMLGGLSVPADAVAMSLVCTSIH